MKTIFHVFTILLITVACGCQSTGSVTNQLPDYIPPEQIESTVHIGIGKSGASAVILDSNHLLTNYHVWATKNVEPWWEEELLPEQEVRVYGTCTSCKKFHGKKLDFQLVDAGEIVTEDATKFAKYDRISDWALIKTDKPNWDAKNTAVIHPDALDPEWRVPHGTELFILGYSPIFFNEDAPIEIENETDKPLSDAIVNKGRRMLFISDGPYTIRGEAVTFGDMRAVLYPLDWPKPDGHSGGGVYLWNADAERLELVGVFHSQSRGSKRANIFELIKIPLGETKVLIYSPIAPALQALKSSNQ